MKNFCVNPYYALSSGIFTEDRPCCVLRPYDDVEPDRSTLQKQFDDGEYSKFCETCWRDEKNGVVSKRIQDNQSLIRNTNKDLETLYEERHSETMLSFQYKASNLCNLKCKTCHSSDSSRWYNEDKHFGRTSYNGINTNDPNKISDEHLQSLVFLEILGGEPFLDNSHMRLLERLIGVGNTRLQISYQTNGQQMPNEKLSKLLEWFPNITISLSVDATHKVFDYMRYPGKWEKLVDTLSKFKANNWHVSAYCTLSNMNVFYFDYLFEWGMKNFAINEFAWQFIYTPKEMAVNVMPESLKKRITDKFQQHKFATFFKPIIASINKPCDETLLEQFKNTVGGQDEYRKIKAKDFVPEIVDYLY